MLPSREQVERLKQELTDRYVEVTGDRPELSRFKGTVGQIKTVNMNGRLLVEFVDFHRNVGWYDLEPTAVRLVERPATTPTKAAATAEPVAEPAKPVAQPPVEKKLSPIEQIRLAKAQAAGQAPAPAAKPAPKAKPAAPATTTPADKPTFDATPAALRAAREAAASRGTAGAQGYPTTADILDMATGKKPPGWRPPMEKGTNALTRRKPLGGKITGRRPAAPPLTTADILAMARGEQRRQAPIEAATSTDSAASAAMPEPKKLTTAEILAQARAAKKS